MEIMDSLIKGYPSLNQFYKDCINLMKDSNELEIKLRAELEYSKESMHYLRLLSILKIRLLSDPIACEEIEKKMSDFNERDRF